MAGPFHATTRDFGNVSPPFAWSGAPEGTRSFALIMEDPDAPTGVFRHWGLYHITGGRTVLPEGVEAGAKTEDLGYCVNDFGELKYAGPMPPAGDPPTATSYGWRRSTVIGSRRRRPCR